MRTLLAITFGLCSVAAGLTATEADQHLADYFRAETEAIAQQCLGDVETLNDWNERHADYRRELFEMLSLEPLPPRTELKAQVTGLVEHDSFTVENLHFQSMPGLYVTANLYLPKALEGRAPTVLYVCGHGPVITNGISYGNKVTYQHHGAWFARNGYVCMLIDTLQLGEIQGLHHGTYREKMWWWNARGYTPAGVEAWNSIRALDYLATRPEVDTNRFGVTGRSGGGAYSWWLAALDDRVKVAAPVAGITDLHNHVVDGVVEGHCDCMFTVNTYRWDYPQVAALVAPRPLLIVNTDSDYIFPLDGVVRTHERVRRIYRLFNAPMNLGLVIGPGPHKDIQDIQVPVFRWFNRHLKGEDAPVEMAAAKFFTPQQLKVFAELPGDALNARIHADFVPMAEPPPVAADESMWRQQRDIWMAALKHKAFGGWPNEPMKLKPTTKKSAVRSGMKLEVLEFLSQPHVPLRLYILSSENLPKPNRVVLRVLDDADENDPSSSFTDWVAMLKTEFGPELQDEMAAVSNRLAGEGREESLKAAVADAQTVFAWLAPRGIGVGAWSGDVRKQNHIRRRFMLLGQTLEGMRAWDIRRAIHLIRHRWAETPLHLEAAGDMAVNALYASVFESDIEQLNLVMPPVSHMTGPDYLNVLRIVDVPQTVAMAADRCRVIVETTEPGAWAYPRSVASGLNWPDGRLSILTAQ